MRIIDIFISYEYNKGGSYEALLENEERVPISSVQFKEMLDAYNKYGCIPYEYDGLRKVIYQHITPEMIKRAGEKMIEPCEEWFNGDDENTLNQGHNVKRVEVSEGKIDIISDQTAKADAGKPRLSLVPTEIINCIARVREYGVKKYTNPDNWKRVEVERYHDALFRHLIAYINDPKSVDEESGLPHLWHVATNCAFLCELEKKK